MPDETKGTDFLLGQLVSKVDGLTQTVNTSSITMAEKLTLHFQSDEKNFQELRRQMEIERKEREDQLEKNRKEQNEARNFIAKITGALILLSAVASYLIPYLLSKI